MKCVFLYSHFLYEPLDTEEMPTMLPLQYWGGGVCKVSHAGSLLNLFSTEPHQRTELSKRRKHCIYISVCFPCM